MLGDLDANGLHRAVSEDIRKMQRELGVTADGTLGNETWAALRRSLDETERQIRDSLRFVPSAHVDPPFYTLEGNTKHSHEPGAVLSGAPSKPSRWHRLREKLAGEPAKLCKVITWSWWWVLAPLWIPLVICAAFALLITIMED